MFSTFCKTGLFKILQLVNPEITSCFGKFRSKLLEQTLGLGALAVYTVMGLEIPEQRWARSKMGFSTGELPQLADFLFEGTFLGTSLLYGCHLLIGYVNKMINGDG